jgi:hypothetical protein
MWILENDDMKNELQISRQVTFLIMTNHERQTDFFIKKSMSYKHYFPSHPCKNATMPGQEQLNMAFLLTVHTWYIVNKCRIWLNSCVMYMHLCIIIYAAKLH